MPNITQPVLTAKLRELEADGLVRRKVHNGNRPEVEYEITAGARRFRPFVRAIMKLARQKALSREADCRGPRAAGPTD